MTKQEFLAMSLGKELILQSPYGFRPNGKESTGVFRLVYLTGDLYADIENKTFPEEFIPILHPLSDLTKEIEHKGEKFVPIEKIEDIIGSGWCEAFEEAVYVMGEWDLEMLSKKVTYLPFEFIRLFTFWHFDIADLISKGEAIDVNTLEENPYK